MCLEAKIQNPICIRLGKNSNVVLVDDEIYPLEQGVIFGSEHYGFILISNKNGYQKENIYPTQCRITAIGTEDEVLRIYEEGKKFIWQFTKTGKLELSAFENEKNKFKVII